MWYIDLILMTTPGLFFLIAQYLPMMKKILFFLAFCSFFLESIAQQRLNSDIKGILYNKEKALDTRILTQGWAADVYLGTLKTYYKTQYYRFGIGNLTHPKEKRTPTEYVATGFSTGVRHYRYGKQNYLYTLHGGLGMKHYYTEKAKRKGVSLAMNYSGGIIAGLLIPYYLDVSDPQKKGNSSLIRYSDKTAALFLNRQYIRGKGGVLKGLKEMSVVPGAYAQVGVHLDWGAFDEFLHAVEVGVQLQVFPKKMPIMIIEDNKPYFFNLYLSLQIGKRN